METTFELHQNPLGLDAAVDWPVFLLLWSTAYSLPIPGDIFLQERLDLVINDW